MNNDKTYRRYQKWICSLGLIVVLLLSMLMLTSCEPATRLTVESKTATDVTIIYQRFDKSGVPSGTETLGTVPAVK